MMALSQDVLGLLWQSMGLYFPSPLALDAGSSLAQKQVVTGDVVFSPSFSPGPLLVLLVTSVMFVF